MTKLHEIIAVEGDLAATSAKIMAEATVTFTKKADHFIESHKAVTMLDDARSGENTEDYKAMVTTVHDKLAYVQKHVSKYWDTLTTKETANQGARADIVVDDALIIANVPVVVLLNLESKLRLLRDVYEAVPTLNPGVHWERDEDHGAHLWRDSKPTTRFKTEKTTKHQVLYEATDKHPAQIDKWTADINVGTTIQTTWSGMLSPAEKSDLLGRIDKLIRGVKRARQRANTIEITQEKVAGALFDYINGAS